MKIINFTQFCKLHGFPCDYDTMFQAQILGSRGLDGSVSKRSVSKQDDEFHQMQAKNMEAHALFYDAVKNGDIIDGSGELKKESIIRNEADEQHKAVESKVSILRGKIQFIESLGGMSHMRNGNLKKGYKMQVEEYIKQIESLTL